MKKSTKNMLLAFILNFSFSVLELIGGFLTNSISIISDSVHDLGDSVSIGASLVLEHKSSKKPNAQYTFGYLRLSVLGAFLTAAILLVGSIFVIYQSVCRFISPTEVNYDGMLIFAIVGIVVNGLAALKTAHGHSLNEKTLSLHMLEDVLGWGAILIGSFVIKFTHWHWIDPILSLAIALFVLYHAYGHIKEVLDVVLEKTPHEIDVEHLRKELSAVHKVEDVHHLHFWSMDAQAHYASLHALIGKNTTPDEFEAVKAELRHVLSHHGINHATIEMEYVHCGEDHCSVEHHHHEHHHHHH